jgi:hypothetical protein
MAPLSGNCWTGFRRQLSAPPVPWRPSRGPLRAREARPLPSGRPDWLGNSAVRAGRAAGAPTMPVSHAPREGAVAGSVTIQATWWDEGDAPREDRRRLPAGRRYLAGAPVAEPRIPGGRPPRLPEAVIARDCETAVPPRDPHRRRRVSKRDQVGEQPQEERTAHGGFVPRPAIPFQQSGLRCRAGPPA